LLRCNGTCCSAANPIMHGEVRLGGVFLWAIRGVAYYSTTADLSHELRA
jgi:hypothetical protein